MTEEQYKKREKKINILSMGVLVLLIFFLAFCAWKRLADTPVFPVGIGFMLVLHWFFSDVLSVKWLDMFNEKNEEQKKSYYVYAAMELIGFGGLTYFLIDMTSTVGAIVYVGTMFMKKKFLDDFKGISPDENEEEEAAEEVTGENGEEIPLAELEIPEVRAVEKDLIEQTQSYE